MKDPAETAETDRLVAEMEGLPDYEGWQFSYEYPGYFCYHHPDLPFRVAFTPDWGDPQTLPIEVTDDDGVHYEEHSDQLPLPCEGRSGAKLLALVRPTLDKLGSLPRPERTIELHVSLTAAEIAALGAALDHVRVHMAHQHPWAVRDAAVTGIGKMIAAAAKARES